MKPANAVFRPFASYVHNRVADLETVVDFSRALEDLAHHVVQPWTVYADRSDGQPPCPGDTASVGQIRVGDSASIMRGWLCTHLNLPPLAALVDASQWGDWQLQLDSDGLCDVYVDGCRVHERHFLHGTVTLAPARPGLVQPWVACHLDTTIQPLRWEMARARLSGLAEINDLVRDVARSLRTAASLLSTSNPRINRFISGEVATNRSDLSPAQRAELTAVLVRAARQVDVAAVARRDLAALTTSLHAAREALAPLADFAKRFTVFLLGVAHMDLAWKWRWPQTIDCMQGTLTNQVGFMKERSDFTFLESSPPVWKAMQQRDPQLYQQLLDYGRKGQFEPAGGMWVEPDGQMLSAESWVRQLLYGQQAAVEVTGQQARAGHNTDAFGFSWGLPKIYAQAGINAFLTQKMRYNEFTVFEEVLFWWESDDGTRILGVHTYPDHYQEIDGDELAEATRIFHVTSGVYASAILFGIGNHGGGPLPDMFDRIDDLRRQTVYPNVVMGGMHQYIDHLQANESQALKGLPVIRDELFLECHHKTYTVQGRTKAANRSAERRLYHAEALAVMAGLDTVARLREAWEKMLFNQFHDILPGTSFASVYQDVFDDYALVQQRVASVHQEAMNKLLGEGTTLSVVNTLPWSRRGRVELPAAGLADCGQFTADDGQAVAYQKIDEQTAIAVLAAAPAFGVRQLRNPKATQAQAIPHGPTWVENDWFRAEFDPDRGLIRSLKLTDGTELAGDGIGRLDILEDKPQGFYHTWNMGLTGKEEQARCDRFEVIESGPVRVVFRAQLSYVCWEKRKGYMVPIMWNAPGIHHPNSFFTVDFAVYRELPWIECCLKADWWEDDTDLKVAADTSLSATRARYGIAFGSIERPVTRDTPYEKARYEVPALNWADLSDGRHGLAIFNTSRHGHDALYGRLRLTLLTSPNGGERVHVPDPLADRGRHELHYAFYPHAGDPVEGQVARMAMEYEMALQAGRGDQPTVPVGRDLLAVDPTRTLVSAVKPAEQGDGFVVRCYEAAGEQCPLQITGELAKGKTSAVNLLEEPQKAVDTLKPHQIVSVKYTR